MNTYSINGKEITLYSFIGEVAEAGKNMETIVSGGGGAGNSSVHISSRTVVHDQIFLIDKDGNESSFQLEDFNVACRKGNNLMVIWGIRKGENNGPCIVAHNYTTNETFYNDSFIKRLFRRELPFVVIPIAIIAIIFFAYKFYLMVGWIGIAILIAFFYRLLTLLNRRYKNKIKEFKHSINFDDFQ